MFLHLKRLAAILQRERKGRERKYPGLEAENTRRKRKR
jgi:hypothetical protein